MRASFAQTGGTVRGFSGLGPALACLLAVFLLSGCAGYKAQLAVKAVAEPEELGKKAPVSVRAKDARDNPVVCKNAGAMGMASEVTLAPGVEDQLARAAAALLSEKGFVPGPDDPQTARKVEVSLTRLVCVNAFGGNETVAKAEAELLVTVDNNGHADERRYAGETVWRLDGENMEPDYDRLFSQTISKTLARLGADYDFLNELASVKLRSKDLQ